MNPMRRFSLGVASFLFLAVAFARPATADEIWVAPTSQQDLGGIGVASNAFWPVTAVGAVRLAWAVPGNLQAFQNARLVLIPNAPGGAGTLNFFVCAAAHGQPAAGACSGPHAVPFVGVANQLVEVDISAAIAAKVGVAGANHLAVLAYTTPTTVTDRILGLRFAFDPVVPPGAATLGANTFSGTQTAPAFVGDGSGLTNVPLPGGAATLGANTFAGTQTAPAFVGDGAGLANVNATLLDGFDSVAFAPAAHFHDASQIVNGASLGGNLFTGTQTIIGGNLGLGSSTATTGLLTKNGARFLHDFGSTNNTYVGLNAGNLTMTGGSNTGVGSFTLFNNTTGVGNVAIGGSALQSNTTGGGNTASGGNSLADNVDGFQNTASGNSAMRHNTSGANNTAMGVSALHFTTEGNGNTASGINALRNNTTGSNNVAVGQGAGLNATTGSNNIYLGANISGVAGEANTMYLGRIGTQTRAFIAGVRGIAPANPDALPVVIDSAGQLGTVSAAGVATLGANTFTGTQTAPAFAGNGAAVTNVNATLLDGIDSAAFAPAAHGHNVSQIANAATLGANSFTATQIINGGNLDLDSSTATTGLLTKNGARFLHNFGSTNSTYLGLNAGNLTMTGIGNTSVGSFTLLNNTTGVGNVAVGGSALVSNTTGGGNTATGVNSLFDNLDGSQNTATGSSAMRHNTSGVNNTAMGVSALHFTTEGDGNVASGFNALRNNTTGSNNVAVGQSAGVSATTGSNNIYLGANTFGVAGEANTMYLGRVGTQTRAFVAGVRGITTTISDAIPVMIDSAGQLGTVSSSRRYKEDIHDMGDASRRLLQLRPVTFRYRQSFGDGSKPIQYGLIAEEVAAVFPDLAVVNADGEPETVQYQHLSVLLLNELQKQHRRMQALEQQVKELAERLARAR